MCKTSHGHQQVLVGSLDGPEEPTRVDVCTFITQIASQPISHTFELIATCADDLDVSMVIDASDMKICRVEVKVSSALGVVGDYVRDEVRLHDLWDSMKGQLKALQKKSQCAILFRSENGDFPVVLECYYERFPEFLNAVSELVASNPQPAREFSNQIDSAFYAMHADFGA